MAYDVMGIDPDEGTIGKVTGDYPSLEAAIDAAKFYIADWHMLAIWRYGQAVALVSELRDGSVVVLDELDGR